MELNKRRYAQYKLRTTEIGLGTPRVLRTNNGALFNGKESHLLRQFLKYRGVDLRPNISAEDPEASGQVEAFMKHIKKVFHTAEITGKDPHHKLTDHLMAYRPPHTPQLERVLQNSYLDESLSPISQTGGQAWQWGGRKSSRPERRTSSGRTE